MKLRCTETSGRNAEQVLTPRRLGEQAAST